MYQLIRPIRVFFLLFQVSKPVPSAAILPSVLLLSVWLIADRFAPAMAVQWAIAAAFVTFVSLQVPRLLPRIAFLIGPGTTATVTLFATTVPLLFLLGTDAETAQRALSIGTLLSAAVLVTGLLEKSGAILRLIWPDRRMEPMRQDIARAMSLKYLAVFMLNETLILHGRVDLWLGVVALLPFALHYLSSAATTLIFFDHQRRS